MHWFMTLLTVLTTLSTLQLESSLSLRINESLAFSAFSQVVSVVFVGSNRISNTNHDPAKELVVL